MLSTFWLPNSAFSNQIEETPGIDCGCSKTGNYTALHRGTDPAVKLGTNVEEGTSPKDIYYIEVSGGKINIWENKVGGEHILEINGVSGSDGWGFSPDDHRFVHHFIAAGQQKVQLYDLRQRPGVQVREISRTHITGETSRIRFSPEGIYLFYLSVTASGQNMVSVIDTSGTVMHETSFTHSDGVGLEDDKFQNSNWNFSRDDHNRTLVYGWTTGENSVHIRAVNLAAGEVIADIPLTTVYSSFWRFSSCGDVMGLYIQEAGVVSPTTPNPVRIRLIRTRDGHDLYNQSFSSIDYTVFSTDASHHKVTIGTTTYTLAPNTGAATCPVEPEPEAELTDLSITHTTITGGEKAGGTITLTEPAPSGGFVVELSSNRTDVTVPSSVTVPSGQTVENFDINTTPVLSTVTATITAKAKGTVRSRYLSVRPPRLHLVELNPDSVYSGNSGRLRLELDGAAPSGGVWVTLESDLSDMSDAFDLPDSARIWAGSKNATVLFETRGIGEPMEIEISGTLAQTRSAILRLLPAELSRINYDFGIFSPCVLRWSDNQAIGGRPIGYRVELNGEAPPDGAIITLASSDPSAVTTPPFVVIEGRGRSAFFQINTEPVTTTKSVPFQAGYRQKVLEQPLILVKPPVQYIAHELKPQGSERVTSVGINNVGQVLIFSHNDDTYYLWENGNYTEMQFPTPGGLRPSIVGFNDRGQFVGNLPEIINGSGLAIWEDGSLQTLRVSPDVASYSVAAINNKGQVAGSFVTADYQQSIVRWTNRHPEELTKAGDMLDQYYVLITRDINDFGRVTASGWRRFGAPGYWNLFIAVAVDRDYTAFPRAYGSYPEGVHINNHNTWTGGSTQIFRTDGVSTTEIIPPLQNIMQTASAINDREEIVGQVPFDYEMEGFTIRQAIRVTEEGTWPLECLVTDMDAGFELQEALGINNAGQIITHSHFKDDDENFNYFTWLLTPSDAPRANLLVEKSADAETVTTGAQITYTITLTNQGPDEAEAVRLAEIIPSNQRLVSVDAGQGICEEPEGTLHCEIGSLSSGASTQITVITQAVVSGVSENRAVATSSTLEMNPESNRAVTVVSITGGDPVHESADVQAGETGEVDLSNAGMMMDITDGSSSSGSVNVTMYHDEPENSQDLPVVTVQASGGSIDPDSVLIERYWTFEAVGLEDMTYTLCLNISGLDGVDPDFLVVTKRSDSSQPWAVYNSTLRSVDNALYLCVENLTEFSQFAIATEMGTYTPPPDPVGRITLLFPENGSQDVAVDPLFTWQEDENALPYQLQLAKDENFSNMVLDSTLAESSLSLPFVLEHDQSYYWRVRAEVESVWSEWSELWNFTTIIALPQPVTLSGPDDGEIVNPEDVTFTWESAQPEIQHYAFELATDEDFFNVEVDSLTDKLQIKLYDLTDQSTYWWRVRAKNEAGWGPYSSKRHIVTATVGTGTGAVSDIPEHFELKQNYPNPFNPVTVIGFALPESSDVTLEVYNVLGQQVAVLVSRRMGAGRHEVNFDSSGLTSGIYLYRMQAGTFTETQKMMILK